MTEATTLYIIRHGKTMFNTIGRTQGWSDTPLTKQGEEGIYHLGLGCLVSSFIGGTPVTSYSTNAGIISITGVASRKVFVAAGAWFVLFGLSGKLSTLISAIPAPVIGGVFVVVCGIISVSGMKVMSDVTIHEKEMYVIAVPIIMTLALTLLPKEFLETLPQFSARVSAIVSSIIVCMFAGTTGILNECFPKVTVVSHSERLFTIHLLGINWTSS